MKILIFRWRYWNGVYMEMEIWRYGKIEMDILRWRYEDGELEIWR